jgi:uncharacterized protein (TIGR02452 family)
MPVNLPCLDSDEMAAARRRELGIPRGTAVELGRSAVTIATQGWYLFRSGQKVDLADSVAAARAGTRSLAPDADLGEAPSRAPLTMHIQVSNETTLGAARRLWDGGRTRPVVLNFANGLNPGGGFLVGARAQEETLCRSSALYQTLQGDRMYEVHHAAGDPASSDWVIYSPDVPVFRDDTGQLLPQPWPLSVLTCAAPYAPHVGKQRSNALLEQRIQRVLAVARAQGHTEIILGAWGCGAFGNDPALTALSFRSALTGPFVDAFSQVVFAVTDWTPERRTLGDFRDAFAPPRDIPTSPRPAVRTDWQTQPLPDHHATLPLDRRFTDEEIAAIGLGVVPEQMEDKWFVFWEDDVLYFHRSWTGICIYAARFARDEQGWRLVEVKANRERDRLPDDVDNRDVDTLHYLVDALLLRQDAPFPIEGATEAQTAIANWQLVGRAMLGQRPS